MVLAEAGARLYREQLDRPPSLADGLRCLAGTREPFALVGAWAGGGALLGCAPVRTAGADEDPFELLASADAGTGAGIGVGGGWIGYLGYELRTRIERLQASPPRSSALPPFALAYYDHVIRADAAGAWWFEALWSAERAAALAERLAWWRARIASPPPPSRRVRAVGVCPRAPPRTPSSSRPAVSGSTPATSTRRTSVVSSRAASKAPRSNSSFAASAPSPPTALPTSPGLGARSRAFRRSCSSSATAARSVRRRSRARAREPAIRGWRARSASSSRAPRRIARRT